MQIIMYLHQTSNQTKPAPFVLDWVLELTLHPVKCFHTAIYFCCTLPNFLIFPKYCFSEMLICQISLILLFFMFSSLECVVTASQIFFKHDTVCQVFRVET